MELTREHWSVEDGKEFQKYLLTLGKGEEKSAWEKRIINTQMPCIAVQSPEVSKVISGIAKGNFMEFLDLWLWDNFTNTSINGSLICRIKDFEVMKSYLLKYALRVDNWASADLLKFRVNDKNKAQYFALSKQYIHHEKPFVRRIGLSILFKLIEDQEYIDKILEIANEYYSETEYYVNMMVAWLVAECFAKQRDKTFAFLRDNRLNVFTQNKAISKCRDSYRVSDEDKRALVELRK